MALRSFVKKWNARQLFTLPYITTWEVFHGWGMGIPMHPPMDFVSFSDLQRLVDLGMCQNATPSQVRHTRGKKSLFLIVISTSAAFCNIHRKIKIPLRIVFVQEGTCNAGNPCTMVQGC